MKVSQRLWITFSPLVLFGSQAAQASGIDLNLDDAGVSHRLGFALSDTNIGINALDSIKKAMETTAKGMLNYYTGYRPGDVPGNLPDPYYWWEAGAMFGAMVEYWYYTGDDQWNDWITQALLHQVGLDDNYMPSNQTLSLGNDDQIFWAFAVMSAAELKYPNPPSDQPQWLELAENVFNSQVARWGTTLCGGGLHWQIYSSNPGYSLKNSISNGGLFNVATRLARYTGNDTYTEWANKIWDWCWDLGYITPHYTIYDAADSSNNCTVMQKNQYAYLPAVFMHGAANMYNITNGSAIWKKRMSGIVNALGAFFENDIMTQPCEVAQRCSLNDRSYKAYLSRFAAASIPLAPFTEQPLGTKLNKSAIAAAQQCNGPNGACGARWTKPTFTGTTGIGEQMSAMEVFKAILVHTVKAPVTGSTGGTSKGASPGEPGEGSGEGSDIRTRAITGGDRAGGAVFAFLAAIVPIAAGIFMTEMV